MKVRKRNTLFVFVILLCMAFSACGGLKDSDNGNGTMTLCVGAYPDSVDPALNSAVDGGTYIVHVFSGLVGFEQDKDGKMVLIPDCATELPTGVATADGKTAYTFKLRDGLKWSDGTLLTANDFVYAWNRAADPITGADYGYMFEVIDGYDEMLEMYDENGNLKGEKKSLNVTASEDGTELTVVLTVDVPYFHELCAFPAYMPVRQDIVEANGDAWATAPATYIGNGAYKVTEFTQTRMVLEKNEYFHNTDKVVTDKIIFAFNDNDASLLLNYQNGSYLFIDSVPNDELKSLRSGKYKEQFYVEGQLGTYYLSFNVNDAALAGFSETEKEMLRKALGLMIDRNYICEDIGQAGQVPAAGFVAMGLTEPDGKEFIEKNGPKRDGAGYYSVADADYQANCDKAIALLGEVAVSSGKFTMDGNKASGFPTLTYITNKGTGHEAIATYLQQIWGNYGIEVKVEVQEWATFLNTRKAGDYSIARNGWLGDYNDPISFLDMWISESGNNDCRFGKGAHADFAGYDGKTWAESYDAIIVQVKSSGDANKRFELMHEAEDILMETGAICPIYYYTDIYMCSASIDGFFSNPLGFKYFMYASVK
ncbi:MAG: peptide ABC transporter substrate-binding protein [Lachnospiraceae bacterium]|nr:peptide ABC transporter substrate-binding protein [Lachnospiraceae bacterium]